MAKFAYYRLLALLGGVPYVFPDPKDPSKLFGFELDIVEAIAKQLGIIGPSGRGKARSSVYQWPRDL